MLGTVNKVILIGNLGEDVKIQYFEGGNSVARFALATNEVFVRKSGERITHTEWHYLVVQNNLAQLCEQYLSKGDRIYVEGKIRSKYWKDERGVSKQIVEIHVTELIFLSLKKNEEQQNRRHLAEEIEKFQIPKKSDLDDLNETPF